MTLVSGKTYCVADSYRFIPHNGWFHLENALSYIGDNIKPGRFFRKSSRPYGDSVDECIARDGDTITYRTHSSAETTEHVDKFALIVGNGRDTSYRTNAHTLDWDGVPWYQGRPQFGGNGQDDGAQTVVANGDKAVTLASSTEGSELTFDITVDDDGNLYVGGMLAGAAALTCEIVDGVAVVKEASM